jgi:hypothetical protein
MVLITTIDMVALVTWLLPEWEGLAEYDMTRRDGSVGVPWNGMHDFPGVGRRGWG